MFGSAIVNVSNSITARVGLIGSVRKRKRATDSVQFRRSGRPAAEATPFADISSLPLLASSNTGTELLPSTSPRRAGERLVRNQVVNTSSSSSESDDDDEVYDYVPLLPDSACSSNAALYLEKKNHTFMDTDDNIRFRIVDVCEGRKAGARGGNNALLFYKYIDIEDPDCEPNYTLCRELLNSSWAKWDPSAAASSRAARLTARMSVSSGITSRRSTRKKC